MVEIGPPRSQHGSTKAALLLWLLGICLTPLKSVPQPTPYHPTFEGQRMRFWHELVIIVPLEIRNCLQLPS
jgi:hypothetical protein